jgi:uncharacterized protein YkwD
VNAVTWLLAALSLGALQLSAAEGGVGADGANAARLVAAAQSVRRAGCAQRGGVAIPLQRDAQLDRVAAEWSRGGMLAAALGRAGVRAKRSASLQVSVGLPAGQLENSLRTGLCTALTTADYTALGLHATDSQAWIVVAQRFITPAPSAAGAIATRILQLVNRARSEPRRCGRREFAAAPPLQSSSLLDGAARTQAQDMAAHSVLSHRGSDGSDPGARATRAGYRWRVVGENVASGPQTAEEAIAGWLDSPDHCENIMDPRYAETGIAFAVNPRSSGVIYWSQVFGLPR